MEPFQGYPAKPCMGFSKCNLYLPSLALDPTKSSSSATNNSMPSPLVLQASSTPYTPSKNLWSSDLGCLHLITAACILLGTELSVWQPPPVGTLSRQKSEILHLQNLQQKTSPLKTYLFNTAYGICCLLFCFNYFLFVCCLFCLPIC